MTIYEFFKANETMFKLALVNGVEPENVERLKLYEEYKRLRKEGHKKTYIYYYLANRFKCSERTITRVVQRMDMRVKFDTK